MRMRISMMLALPACCLGVSPIAALAQEPAVPLEAGAPVRAAYETYLRAAAVDAETSFAIVNQVIQPGSRYDWRRSQRAHFETSSCSPQADYREATRRRTPDQVDVVPPRPEAGEPSLAESIDEELLGLARTVAIYRLSMVRGGYPRAVYEAPLRRLVRARLDHIDAILRAAPRARYAILHGYAGEPDHWGIFENELEANRRRIDPRLPPFEATFDCGGGETFAIVRSEPPGARVWVISRFRFELCRAQGRDPLNLQQCTRWIEAIPEQSLAMAGNYMYQARWPNGTITNSALQIRASDDRATTIYRVRPNPN